VPQLIDRVLTAAEMRSGILVKMLRCKLAVESQMSAAPFPAVSDSKHPSAGTAGKTS